mmetsp:Transcript_43616/g.79487  ORF Transcript_43616/g.79487 Transcript_43616/m.79487 type:complete len:527 (+) Transcript_43616:93-1673(+)
MPAMDWDPEQAVSEVMFAEQHDDGTRQESIGIGGLVLQSHPKDDELALTMNTLTSGRRRTYPNRSSFQAHVCCVMSLSQVQLVLQILRSNAQLATARHWPYAYRILAPEHGGMLEGFEDDGNEGAGEKMLDLLTRTGLENLLLVASHWCSGPAEKLGAELFRCVHVQCKELLLDVQEAIHAAFPKEQLLDGSTEAEFRLHEGQQAASIFFGWQHGSSSASQAQDSMGEDSVLGVMHETTEGPAEDKRALVQQLVECPLPEAPYPLGEGFAPPTHRKKAEKVRVSASWEDEAIRLPDVHPQSSLAQDHLQVAKCTLSARSEVDEETSHLPLLQETVDPTRFSILEQMVQVSGPCADNSPRRSSRMPVSGRRATRAILDALGREASQPWNPSLYTPEALEPKSSQELSRLVEKLRTERDTLASRLSAGKASEVVRKLNLPIFYGDTAEVNGAGGKMGKMSSLLSRGSDSPYRSSRQRGRKSLMSSRLSISNDAPRAKGSTSQGSSALGRSRLSPQSEMSEDATFLTAR